MFPHKQQKSHHGITSKVKINRLPKAFESQYAKSLAVITGTGSTTSLQISDRAIDYIFTDPPFGENIYYADLNFMVESWYDVLSNATAESHR